MASLWEKYVVECESVPDEKLNQLRPNADDVAFLVSCVRFLRDRLRVAEGKVKRLASLEDRLCAIFKKESVPEDVKSLDWTWFTSPTG